MNPCILALVSGAILPAILLASPLASESDGAVRPGKAKLRDIKKEKFGKLPDGTVIHRFTLRNSKGLVAKLMSYGAILTELRVPDRKGKPADVVLGFGTLAPYLGEHPYFGSTVGRVANRIAKGKFELDGKSYSLAINNGPNHLHGGLQGFNRVVWQAEPMVTPEGAAAVKFSRLSPAGEEGYPGNVSVQVVYSLTEQNELKIEYSATTDQPTPVNLTHHSYFNLAGSGDILGHELMLAADHYTPVDDTLIPTGEIKPVKGTPMDFTQPAAIGSRITQLTGDPGGYDHNYVLNSGGTSPALALRVREPKSGRIMELYTTEPGIQFYTGNFLDGTLKGKRGTVYQKHYGFCVEADHFPDAVHHPNFPSIILRPGQTYHQLTIHKFSTE